MANQEENTRISGNGSAERNGGTSLLPIIILFALFVAVFYCGWQIWQNYAELAAKNNDDALLDTLKAQRKELEGILALPPCEAMRKLNPATGTKALREKNPILPATAPASAPDAQKASAAGKAVKYASSPEEVEDACVFLVGIAGPGKLATGSGFFVAPDYIITNRHVVSSSSGKLLVTSKALGQPVAGHVVSRGAGKGRDFALVNIKTPAGANVANLKFAPEVKKTQKVGAWGFPDIIGKNDPAYARLLKGQDFTSVPELSYSEGVVSAVLNRSPRLIVHTAPISPGNSGGPLLNEKNEVVGINTMITLDEDSYRQASIALDARNLEDFLRENGLAAQH